MNYKLLTLIVMIGITGSIKSISHEEFSEKANEEYENKWNGVKNRYFSGCAREENQVSEPEKIWLQVLCKHCKHINSIQVPKDPEWAVTSFDCQKCKDYNDDLKTKYHKKGDYYEYKDKRIVG